MAFGTQGPELKALLRVLLNKRGQQPTPAPPPIDEANACVGYKSRGQEELQTILRLLVDQRERLDKSLDVAAVRHGTSSVVASVRAADRNERQKKKRDERTRNGLQRREWAGTTILRHHADKTLPSLGPEPEAWCIIEAIAYFNRVIIPLCAENEFTEDEPESSNTSTPMPMPPYNQRHGFILIALGFHMGALSRAQGVLPTELYNASHLWTKFYHHMAASLQMINDGIKNPGTIKVLHRIADVAAAELSVGAPGWRAHAEGFATMLRLGGGLKKAFESNDVFPTAVQYMMLSSIMGNTTSPPDDHIEGAYYYTNDEIREFYGCNSYDALSCPTDLFLEIAAINRLRRMIATEPDASAAVIKADANAIFTRITEFDPDEWKESYPLPETPEIPLLASLLKTAVTLYSIMTIGSHALSHPVFTQGQPSADEASSEPPTPTSIFKCTKLKHFNYLLEVLTQVKKTNIHLACSSWPLAVAGVAAVDGTPADRVYVDRSVLDIAESPLTGPSPQKIRRILRDFWASGMMGWDECYYKPVLAMSTV